MRGCRLAAWLTTVVLGAAVWISSCAAICFWQTFGFDPIAAFTYGTSSYFGMCLTIGLTVSLVGISRRSRFIIFSGTILIAAAVFVSGALIAPKLAKAFPGPPVSPADLFLLAALTPLFIAFAGLAPAVLRVYRGLLLLGPNLDPQSVRHRFCLDYSGIVVFSSLLPLVASKYIDHPETESFYFLIYAIVSISVGATFGLLVVCALFATRWRHATLISAVSILAISFGVFISSPSVSAFLCEPPRTSLMQLFRLCFAATSGTIVLILNLLILRLAGCRLELPMRQYSNSQREALAHPLDSVL